MQESYEDWRTHFLKERLRILYLVAIFGNPTILAVDYMQGDHWPSLFLLRGVLQVTWVIGFFILRYQHTAIRLNAMLVFWILGPNVGISEMTIVLGGFSSQYFTGIYFIFLCAAVVASVSWKTHLVAQLGSLTYYFGANLVRSGFNTNLGDISVNFMLVLWMCIAFLTSVFLHERLQRSEFQARVSERLARKELEATNEKLLELDHLKSEFFANISHELRTPLTLSLGAFQFLDKKLPTSDCQEAVQSGLRNTSRLLFLINELLDLARFESGRADLRKQYFDLSPLVRSVSANFESSEGKHLHLDGLNFPVAIEANPGQMKKLLYNLLSNAFKFTDPQHRQVWIRLRAAEDSVRLEVKDNGIGIPPDHLTSVFDRFTQVEGAATRRYEGTGIGLALVKEIVTHHDGEITVDSELGRGSTFTMTLPRGQANLHNLVTLESEDESILPHSIDVNRRENTDDHTIPSPGPHDQPLILVADDNPDMRQYLHRILSPHYRIASAKDGVEALSRAKKIDPDLILTDVMMPHMSGDDLLRAIREDQGLKSVPVIFLTARVGIEARVESLEAGADDYIAKPFHEEELLARIRNQFRLHSQEREIEAHAVELQQLNQQLEKMNEKLKELDLRKSEFVSMVAHELRTPMTSMGGLVDNMLDGLVGALTEKQRFYLNRFKSNLERLTRMIPELLDLSRIEAGQVDVQTKALDVVQLVEPIIESFKPMAREKRIALQAMEVSSLPMILGDTDKLTQVVTNLIQNAIKFTPEGGKVHVEFQERDERSVQVTIADTGCGIPDSDRNKVFEKFYRGESVTREARGAGLGLAIVKQIVELHQGRIWVQSTPGEGSRFSFTVPYVSST